MISRDGIMGEDACDRADQLQRAQTIIEYGLAVVIPSLFACMLFSYVLMQELFDVFFALSIIVAATLMIPAKIISDLHFHCWSKHVMPKKLVNGMLGMIYISEISVFAASLLSIYKGLNPEQPLTFAIMGGLMMVLIVVLTFNDRYGKALAEMDKRCLRLTSEKARDKVIAALGIAGSAFEVEAAKNGFLVSMKADAMSIHIKPLGTGSSEIILERQTGASEALIEAVKAAIID
ncbi:MAG: hypothetical protein ABR986_07460 [Methanomassiliicoccales archaeon]|jgi:hypothetical protein